MSKYSPGPWTIDALGVQARWNIDTLEGTSVAITNQLPGDKNWQERDANTLLIAAAPELLDAVLDLKYKLYGNGPASPKIEALLKRLESIL